MTILGHTMPFADLVRDLAVGAMNVQYRLDEVIAVRMLHRATTHHLAVATEATAEGNDDRALASLSYARTCIQAVQALLLVPVPDEVAP